MPKRKHDSESEDEPSAASTGASSEDEKPAKRVKKQESSKKATKKETKPKPAKKEKEAKAKAKPAAKDDTKDTDASDERSISLGTRRRISVGKFKGMTLVNIREFYTDSSGTERPGKKGIALKLDEWKELIKQADEITKWAEE